MSLLILLVFFGVAAGIIGKIKGSSFSLWFLIGFCIPFGGVLAALLYRFDRNEPRRQCPECGKAQPLYVQVCTRCGRDLDYPLPASGPQV
ncbi:MAG: hypothetical protein M3433_07640 [Actinomycetota bacterium]|nr:hypothetical protein [Actinomycetota bacterium]MDQ3648441.1 hypothetical protein [Actinomycetota bacterium]